MASRRIVKLRRGLLLWPLVGPTRERPGVRREQRLHPTSQVAIMMGPQYQVEVVGHEAIAEQVHRQASASIIASTKAS